MFWIGFTDESLARMEPGGEGRVGLLVLGNFTERFVVHFWTWSEQQYVHHWKDALIRGLDGKPSALITDMRTPSQSNHLVWWPLWRIGDEVLFHNQLLFFEQHKVQGSHIDVERLYDLVGERVSRNSEGVPLSEWIISVSEVEAFLASLAAMPPR
jgi:hypothetical protein